ncbi:MAG: ABC transporter permease subunit [Clostridia bacterium]|nr:ABC transporter permease subunit [Clostridia bacterium]
MKKQWSVKLIVLLLFAYLFLPFLLTGLYSIAERWNTTVLPDGVTFRHYTQLFGDTRFWSAMGRTIGISAVTVAVSVLVMTPLVYSIAVFAPRLERLMKALTLVPFALPGVITAAALMRAYAGAGIPMVGVLSGAYFVLIMPLLYNGILNALRAMDIVPITEAARVLGASTLTAFLRVIVPGIAPGILVSTLLSFSTLFGEYVIVNMLIGGNFETVQIYLALTLRNSGHLSSAIVVVYVLLMTLICFTMILLTRRKDKGADAAGLEGIDESPN